MKTKIEIELDLLLEALSGLKAFGKAATEETVQKIQSVINAECEREENGQPTEITENK